MRRFLVALLLGGTLALAANAAPPDDEKAIRAVLDTQVVAWNKGDLPGFLAGYWNDDKLFFISGGKSVEGFKAVKERYEKAYQGDGREIGKLKFGELHVEMLAPGAALVPGKWEVTTSKETVSGWYTLVLKKFPDGWKITHDHTSK